MLLLVVVLEQCDSCGAGWRGPTLLPHSLPRPKGNPVHQCVILLSTFCHELPPILTVLLK